MGHASEATSRVYVFHRYGGPEGEGLTTRPVPEPGPGEVTVRVHAAGVNPADIKRRAGAFGTRRDPPVPMGLELSGVVTAVGESVTLRPGEAVLGPPRPGAGAFADHTLMRAADAVAKPAALDHDAAACLTVAGVTAWDAVNQLAPAAGETVLITGVGGGVGLLAAQLARARGAVVLGTGSPAKRPLVERFGVELLDGADLRDGAGLAAAVRARAPGGVDAVLDLIGGAPLRAAAALGGRLVTTVDPETAQSLGGSGVRHGPVPVALTALAGAAARGDLVVISAGYPLERAGEALAVVAAGHTAGKVVLRPVG